MVQATHIFAIIFQVIDKATKNLDAIQRELVKIGKNVASVSNTFGGMNKKMLSIGLGMTFMFWGVQMQIQRLLRSSFQFFKEAEGEGGVLITQFNILRANIGGVAIAFWDAFSQSGLMQFITDKVIMLRDWFFNLGDAQRQSFSEGILKAVALILVINILGQTILAAQTIWNFSPWGKVAIAAIIAIYGIIKAGKKLRDATKDVMDEVEKTNAKTWANWENKALEHIYSFIKWLNSLPMMFRRFLGLSTTGLSGELLVGMNNRINELKNTVEAFDNALLMSTMDEPQKLIRQVMAEREKTDLDREQKALINQTTVGNETTSQEALDENTKAINGLSATMKIYGISLPSPIAG